MENPNLSDALRAFLTGRVALVAIGNRDAGDDGAGPLLLDRVRRLLAPAAAGRVTLVDGGICPENQLGRIEKARPRSVLFLDAASFSGAPGEARLFRPDDARVPSLSSHVVSLRAVAAGVEVWGGRCALLAVQTGGSSDAVSPAVRAAVASLAEGLSSILRETGGRTGAAE